MLHRLATLFLLLLTFSFFYYHWANSKNLNPSFVEIIAPQFSNETFIAENEFLLLMEQGKENYLRDVLSEFDLKVISPLGEWVHVAKGEANLVQHKILLRSKKGQENLSLVARLESHHLVHSAHLNYIQNYDPMASCTHKAKEQESDSVSRTPSDSYFPYQWHLSTKDGVDMPGAWAITTGDPRVVIGLVDRHFDFLKPDLHPDNCVHRRYFFEDVTKYFPQKFSSLVQENAQHGAYVLSVIAPCTDNSFGLAGVDWRAQVFAVDTKADDSLSGRLFGILWAAGIDVCSHGSIHCKDSARFQRNLHPAHVLNASFGFGGPYLKDPPYGPVLDVIGTINRKGAMIVASAGNEGALADRRLPGAAGGVISVGASTKMRQSAMFSNFGRTVDVLAPGEDILGLKEGEFISLNGTSFSAPIVSGVCSLMLAVNPLLVWKQAEYILKKTSTPLLCDNYCPRILDANTKYECLNYCCKNNKVVCAHGIINAKEAVKLAKQGVPNTALIDLNDYYLALSLLNGLKTKVTLKNWGKKPAIVRMKQTDPKLVVSPSRIILPPMNASGVPGSLEVTVRYQSKPSFGLVLALIFEAANLDNPQVFHDSIEAIVEIVPDTNPKRKVLRELLPQIGLVRGMRDENSFF